MHEKSGKFKRVAVQRVTVNSRFLRVRLPIPATLVARAVSSANNSLELKVKCKRCAKGKVSIDGMMSPRKKRKRNQENSVDNSDFMRNGDFVPTRMQAQQDAVNLVCMSKTRSNPENNVGLLKMSHVEVLVTLTSDVGRILARLHQVQPKGDISFLTAVRVAHLALKHRQGRNHKMRIVVFVGSPIEEDEKEIIKTAKKLKKEKVNVDIINFGEEGVNTEKLTTFVNTINGKDGSSSHLVTVPPGPMLSDALLSSPVIVGEDGSGAPITGGFEFGVDPNEDPELALVLAQMRELQHQWKWTQLREQRQRKKRLDAIRGAMDALTRDTPKESKDKDQSKKDGKK
nr:hypothetical protein BaRGS_008069 [Batillaria attramentaria]